MPFWLFTFLSRDVKRRVMRAPWGCAATGWLTTCLVNLGLQDFNILQLGRLWHLGRFPDKSGFHRLSQPPLLLRALCGLSKSSRKFVARSQRTFSVGKASEKPLPARGPIMDLSFDLSEALRLSLAQWTGDLRSRSINQFSGSFKHIFFVDLAPGVA